MVGSRIRAQVESARDVGIGFLGEARHVCGVAESDGWWEDFELPVGTSDEWVTAYTACALAQVENGAARELAQSAFSLLKPRAAAHSAGFGYNGRTTGDADSTAWVCRLAGTLGESGPEVRSGLAFLVTCLRDDGGISTYPSAEAVRQTIRISPNMRTDGWTRSHTCVTAAAAGVRGIDNRPLRAYLRSAQLPSGAWSGYWWADPEYATALSIEVLSSSPEDGDAGAVMRAVNWIQSRAPSRSAFVLALRILGVVQAGQGTFDAALDSLLELQQEDGSWASSARLRQPAPYVRNPDRCWYWDYNSTGFGCIRHDQARIFTTATAVWALNAWLQKN